MSDLEVMFDDEMLAFFKEFLSGSAFVQDAENTIFVTDQVGLHVDRGSSAYFFRCIGPSMR